MLLDASGFRNVISKTHVCRCASIVSKIKLSEPKTSNKSFGNKRARITTTPKSNKRNRQTRLACQSL